MTNKNQMTDSLKVMILIHCREKMGLLAQEQKSAVRPANVR